MGINGQSIGNVAMQLTLDNSNFNRQIKNTANSSKNIMGGALSKIGSMAAIAFSVKEIVKFGKACIDVASNLNEVQNVVDTAFTTMNGSVDKFSKDAIKNFGLSELYAKKMSGTFGTMANSFGFTEKQAFDMATSLTGLAGDVSSFYNISADVAQTKLKSVFTGETESLKELGIVMTQNALDAYAMSNGFGKTTREMSEQEKVALRYKFVMDKLQLASGDFAKTQDSWANQSRIFSLQLETVKANLGQTFITILTPVLINLNKFIEIVGKATSRLNDFVQGIFGNKGSIGNSIANSVNQDLSNVANSATNALDKVKKKLSQSHLDEINVLSNTQTDGDNLTDIGNMTGTDVGNIENSATKVNTIFQKILDQAREVAKLFSKGFNLSFTDNSTELLRHLGNIKTSLSQIFDDDVFAAATSLFSTFIYNLGIITGSISNIGLSLGEFLLGSIDLYLEENKDYIKEKIIQLFSIGEDILNLQGDIALFFSVISESLRSDSAKQIGSDILTIFSTAFFSTITLAGQIGIDILDSIIKPFRDNQDLIKTSLENTFSSVESYFDSLKEIVTHLFTKIEEVYKENIEPIFTTIGEVLSNVLAKILEGYNTYLLPVQEKLSQFFTEVVEEKVKPAIDSVLNVFAELGNLLKWFISDCLGPLIVNTVDFLMPIFTTLYEIISSKMIISFGFFADAIKLVSDFIGNLIGLIVGFVTGDSIKLEKCIENLFPKITGTLGNIEEWFKDKKDAIVNIFKNVGEDLGNIFGNAWEKIKRAFTSGGEIFKGITGSISSTFISIVNSLIRGINTVVSIPFKSINKSLDRLRDISILGKSPFSFLPYINTPQIPQIQAYARGMGYFNSPQLIQVGDNRREAEFLNTKSQLVDIIKTTVVSTMSSMNHLNNNTPSENYTEVNFGGERIYSNSRDYMQMVDIRTGSKR